MCCSYRNMHADNFWERVKPSNLGPSQRPVWMTFDDEWVDQVRRGLMACKVFLWYPVYCESSTTSNARRCKPNMS